MVRWCIIVTGAALLLLVLTEQARSESGPVELGFDGGFTLSMPVDPDGYDVDNVATLQFPLQRMRVGFFVSDAVSIEHALGLSYLVVGEESLTEFTAALAGLYHFSVDPARPRLYVGPNGKLSFFSLGSISDAQFSIGALFGVKLPVVTRLAVRIEAAYMYAFESESRLAAHDLSATVGFSFFTK